MTCCQWSAYEELSRLLKIQKNQGRSLAIEFASDLPWEWLSGGVLLSHTVAGAVPSALKGLASGFGMGPGVSPSLWPP